MTPFFLKPFVLSFPDTSPPRPPPSWLGEPCWLCVLPSDLLPLQPGTHTPLPEVVPAVPGHTSNMWPCLTFKCPFFAGYRHESLVTAQRLQASQLLPRAFQFGEQLHPGGSSLKLGLGLPWWLRGKESTCQCWRHGLIPNPGRSHMPWSNYWTRALEPGSLNHRAHVSQLLKPPHPRAHALQQETLPQWEAHVPQLVSSPCFHGNWRKAQP